MEEAYRWVCKTRKDVGPNNGVWDLLFNWQEVKLELIKELRNDSYHLSPLRRYIIEDQRFDCWDARDALVLKAVAIVLSEILTIDIPLSCTNVKDHGGCKKLYEKYKIN